MPDWLLGQPQAGTEARPSVEELCSQVAAAVLAGFVVAAVFRLTIPSRERSAALPTTLVLLTVLTAIVTLVIGSNVARAFGLVGALSIVRFRTVVDDTRDTAFVIFSVVVGMAVGANYTVLAMIAIGAVTVVVCVMRWAIPARVWSGSGKYTVCVRVALGQDGAPVNAVMQKFAAESKTVGVCTAKQGAAMEFTYAVRLAGEPEAMVPFVAELNRIEGVQGVELKESTKS